jgi:NDP-sugar pyrophosphorylase family protein
MDYGIIAAGEGSRLVKEGIKTPKPLITLNGEPLIDRLIRIFTDNNASSISIVINEEMKELQRHISGLKLSVPLHVIIKSTPSSFHSFYELTRFFSREKFCVTTVDTIFKETDFNKYISEFEKLSNSGLMAVTSFIDDEKPLYVKTEDQLRIIAFEDTFSEGIQYISGGIYGLTNAVRPTLLRCIENGIHRMRNFQREIIADHIPLHAYPFPKIIDIDHAEDIKKAETFLQ